MKKIEKIIYETKHGDKFEIIHKKIYCSGNPMGVTGYISINNLSDISKLYLTSPEEIDEFCELLQEKKREIWQ